MELIYFNYCAVAKTTISNHVILACCLIYEIIMQHVKFRVSFSWSSLVSYISKIVGVGGASNEHKWVP